MSRKSTSATSTMENKTNPEGSSTLDLAATGPTPESQPATKRRKVDVKNDASDKLDPVEKLLSFADLHDDILHSLDVETQGEPEECDEIPPSSTPTPSNISVNFTNMLQENLRHYYSNCKRGPLEVYNANSSFAILNKPLTKEQPPPAAPTRHEVPFFKNVNFNPNPKSSSAYTFDEYLAYDDDEPESTSESDSDHLSPDTPTSAHPSPIPTKSKMCFHYRQFNNNLNLSSHPSQAPQEDILQFLNKRSIISGRASEMNVAAVARDTARDSPSNMPATGADSSFAMSLLAYIYTYLLGGLTFVPLCVLVFYFSHPVRPDTTNSSKNDEKFKAGEIEDQAKSGVQALKAGWVTVTHEYWQSTEDISSSTQAVNDSTDNKSAYSSLYKLANKADEADSNTSSSSSLAIGPSSPTSDDKNIKGPQKRHRFYAVLKHGNLFLYKDASVKDVKHVIVLSSQVVTIWPRGIADSQLFTKNSAICIMKKDWSRHRRLSDSFDSETVSTQEIIATENKYHIKAPKGSVFLYCDYNIDKEDWYFALIRASKSDTTPSPLNPNVFAKPLHFATDDMIDMIQTLYSAEGQLHSKWFNAITGRLFLALQKTPAMSAFLENRIAKKLNKIKTPGFLDKFQIKKIDPGTSIPFFTYPALKEVNPDGTLVLSVCVHYHGAMAIQIATKANIKLGSTFKPREVDLLLSVTLEKLEGQMIIKFKPPPSDRIWYTFETEPTMDLKIEPIISSRQFNYNIITSTIGKKFKEAIRDSLVLPHYDDLVFHDTLGEIYRGGIWDQEARGTDFDTAEVSTPPESDAASSITNDIDLDKSAPSAAKVRLSNTINDFTKKLKKSKSSHTVALNEDQCLSDGSIVDTNKNHEGESDTADSSIGKKSMNTMKKIGQWYFKDEKKSKSTVTQSPDMISNRRTPRKSNADQTHSAASSIFNQPSSPKNYISSSAFIREGEHVDFPSSTRESVIEPDAASLSFLGDNSSMRGAHERDSSTSSVRSIHDSGIAAEPTLTEVTPASVLAEYTPSLAHSRLRRKPPPENLASLESDEKHDEMNQEVKEELNEEATVESDEKDETVI